MNVDKNLAHEINQLNQEELQYMCKLVCLMRFCPGFKKELDQLIPVDNETVSRGQLAAIGLLMDKWLYKEGYADLLRAELESAGVKV